MTPEQRERVELIRKIPKRLRTHAETELLAIVDELDPVLPADIRPWAGLTPRSLRDYLGIDI